MSNLAEKQKPSRGVHRAPHRVHTAQPTRRIRPRSSGSLAKTPVGGPWVGAAQAAIAVELAAPHAESLYAGLERGLSVEDLAAQQAGTFFLQLGAPMGIPGADEIAALGQQGQNNGRVEVAGKRTSLEETEDGLVSRETDQRDALPASGRGFISTARPEQVAAAGRELGWHLDRHPKSEALRERHPKVYERIDALVRWATESITDSDLQDEPLEEENLQGLSMAHQKLLRNIYKRMRNGERVGAYLHRLMEDTLVVTEQRGHEGELEALSRGRVTRNNMLRVLVQRSKDRGERLTTVRDKTYDEFDQALRQGPFFDKGFPSDSKHGPDAHLIQWDYVADLLYQPAVGDLSSFNDALADRPWERRHPVFDTLAGNTAARPEYLMPGLQSMVTGYGSFRKTLSTEVNQDMLSLERHAHAELFEVKERHIKAWLEDAPAEVQERRLRSLRAYRREFGIPQSVPGDTLLDKMARFLGWDG